MKEGYIYRENINKENFARFDGTVLSGDAATPSMRINDISKMFAQLIKYGESGLKYSQGARKALIALSKEDGIRQTTLREIIKLSPSTTSNTIRDLEEDGYIRRVIPKDDRRETLVYITDEGRKLAEAVTLLYRNAEETLMEGIGDEEREMLMSILEKMLKNLLMAHKNLQSHKSPPKKRTKGTSGKDNNAEAEKKRGRKKTENNS